MAVEIEAEGEKEHQELAKPLADLLGMKHESRANILQALFAYIRLHKLQVGPLAPRGCTDHIRLAVGWEEGSDWLASSTPVARGQDADNHPVWLAEWAVCPQALLWDLEHTLCSHAHGLPAATPGL